MSGHIGGQTRALPFTGLTSAPFVIVGLVLSLIGFLMTRLRRQDHA
jgi:LPXTG-motif cell wall-anchored protein